MKNINWKVRFRNPVFIAQIAVAVLLPILTYMGMGWEDMTTWATLGRLFVDAVKNPVIVVSVIISVWNAINDPTTKGIGDSTQALGYNKPKDK
jgi:phi LC3 family holin